MPFTFRKEERLCSQKTIELLFAQGQSFVKYPFRVIYLEQPDHTFPVPAQVLMSVSKKRFKRANRRNWIRRRMKEAYRLNKDAFYQWLVKKESGMALAFIYLPTEMLSFAEIEKGIIQSLRKLCETIDHPSGIK